MSNYQRKEVLLSMAKQISERRDELASLLVTEVGKTITDARGEVGRYSSSKLTLGVVLKKTFLLIGQSTHSPLLLRRVCERLASTRWPTSLRVTRVRSRFHLQLMSELNSTSKSPLNKC